MWKFLSSLGTLFGCSERNRTGFEGLVLGNHVILGRILSFLELDELQNARLVCKQWALEAGSQFSSRGILIELLDPDELDSVGLEELTRFVTKHRVEHTLMVSFLRYRWLYNHHLTSEAAYPAANSLYFNQPNYVGTLTEMLDYVATTGEYIKELRLEMNLVEESDGPLLASVLNHLPSLNQVSLDIVASEPEGLLSIPLGLGKSIQILGLRFHHPQEESSLSLPCISHLLSAFQSSPLRILNLDPWQQKYSIFSDSLYTNLCLEAVGSVLSQYPNDNAFPQLEGLRVDVDEHKLINPRLRDPIWPHLLSFSKPLSKIFLSLSNRKEDDLSQLQQLLRRHSGSLKVFELSTGLGLQFMGQQHKLIRLPNLTSLGFLSNGTLKWEGCTLELMDWLGLRTILMEDQLTQLYPKLTTLSVLFPSEGGDDIWTHVFPSEDKEKKQIQIGQIKTLTVSMDADCSSPKVGRLKGIFPCVGTLVHVQQEGNKVFRCEHRYSCEGKVVQRIQRRLRSKDPFADIKWDYFHLIQDGLTPKGSDE